MNILTLNENTLTQNSTADAFAAAGSELGGSALPILKMSKGGSWVYGAQNTPLAETRFARLSVR